MVNMDVISTETTAYLREAAETYQSVLRGFPEMCPGAFRFARDYLERPAAEFSSRITPNTIGSVVNGAVVIRCVETLSVAVDDAEGEPLLNVWIKLGQGAQPAAPTGPQIYNIDDRSPRRPHDPTMHEMTRALTECEGRGLVLDLFAVTKQAALRRSRFSRAVGVAKATLLR